MASVHDVAAALVEREHPMDTWKLQKLAYYCQAWHLVRTDRALFPDRIEAWSGGPVVPALYAQHKGEFLIEAWPAGDLHRLERVEARSVAIVYESYGRLTGNQLRILTHQETPWRHAREGLGPGDRSNRVISLEDMLEYYGGLVDSEEATPIEDLEFGDSEEG